MQKLATFVLMLCLTLSGVFSYAIGVAEQVNKKGNDGTPIEIIKNSSSTSSEVVDSNAPLHFITNLNMSIPYFEGIVQAWRIPESGYYTLLHNFTVTYANYCWLGPQ